MCLCVVCVLCVLCVCVCVVCVVCVCVPDVGWDGDDLRTNNSSTSPPRTTVNPIYRWQRSQTTPPTAPVIDDGVTPDVYATPTDDSAVRDATHALSAVEVTPTKQSPGPVCVFVCECVFVCVSAPPPTPNPHQQVTERHGRGFNTRARAPRGASGTMGYMRPPTTLVPTSQVPQYPSPACVNAF